MVTNLITGKSYMERYASPNWPSDFLHALITFSRKYILRFSTPLGRLNRTSLSSHTNEGNTFRESSSANGCPAITWIRLEMLIMWLRQVKESTNLHIYIYFFFHFIEQKTVVTLFNRFSSNPEVAATFETLRVFFAYLLLYKEICVVSPAEWMLPKSAS